MSKESITTFRQIQLIDFIDGEFIFEPKCESPKVQPKIDWNPLIRLAEKRVKAVSNGTYHDDNDDIHFMFELAMKAIYGKDYFVWQNKNTE